MQLPDFQYYAPETLPEACALLARFGRRARVLAGGTDLLVKMKHGLAAPEILVSLKKLTELKEIRFDPDRGVVIGAAVTHNELINSPLVREKYPSVAEAARQLGNNQIRHRGTVGGNLVNAVPSADLPPLLIALNAAVRLVGNAGERTLPLEEIFTGPNQTVLAADEILTEVIIPAQRTTGSVYLKFGLRRSGALAVAGVAVSVTMEKGFCRDARIVLGAVAPTPLRAKQAEAVLREKTLTPELLAEAGVCAAAEARPISDLRGSAEYRRDLVRVLTRRALTRVIEKGGASNASAD